LSIRKELIAIDYNLVGPGDEIEIEFLQELGDDVGPESITGRSEER
jgi:hypothetical protein